MGKLDIITYGHPLLRQKAEPVEKIDDEIISVIDGMKKALETEGGIGLAAPQVGVMKQIFLVDLTKSDQPHKVALINPKIIFKSLDTVPYEEGCLSIPDVWGDVIRPKKIKIKGQLTNGTSMIIEADGMYARVLQHEYDHLLGKLFIDYLSDVDLTKNRQKIDALLEANRKKLGKIAE